MKNNFIFYESFNQAIITLEKEQQYELIKAIINYGLYGELSEIDGVVMGMFSLIKPQLDANKQRYENGKKGGKFGSLGGRPKKEETPSGLLNETPNKKDKEKDKDKDKEKVKEKKKDKEKYFENENLNNLFIDYLELRKKLKAENTERAIKLLTNKLDKYDDDTKIKMIEQSIENSWKGLFEVKQKNNEPKKYSKEWLEQV